MGASFTAALKTSHNSYALNRGELCNDAHTQAMLAATMSAEDVAVVFSYSGSTKDTNAVAELAKKNGAKVVAITRFQKVAPD